MPDITLEEDRRMALTASRLEQQELHERSFSLKGAAERIARGMNQRIAEGEVSSTFAFAMGIAAFKDLIIDPLAGFTAIFGIGFIIGALSVLISATLLAFLYGKGFFLRAKARMLLWSLGLFIDGIAGLSVLPINMAMVYIAWRNVKKEAEKAKKDLGGLTTKTSTALADLEKEYEDLEYSAS